jgi:hypothetical protein
MAARYQHLTPQFLPQAAGTLDDVFANVCPQDATAMMALPAKSTAAN